MGMYVTSVNLQTQFLCELLGSNTLKNLKSNPGQNHRMRENGNWLHTPREGRCADPSKFFCVMQLPKLAFNSGCVTRMQFTNKEVSCALMGSVANATVKGDTDKAVCSEERKVVRDREIKTGEEKTRRDVLDVPQYLWAALHGQK